MIKPIILGGGTGSRLWPLSRELYPKQFLALTGEDTLFQGTVLRAAALPDALPPLVLCNQEHRFIVAEQLRALDKTGEIILEPVGRNTAPAIAIAALRCLEADPLLLVLPADHQIHPLESFVAAVADAAPLAENGALVTFGIPPTRPETGFGYIRRGEPLGRGYRVSAFVEKPDEPQARAMLAAGNHFWNSGIFLFKASVFLEELERFRPDILAACRQALDASQVDLDFLRLDKAAFSACPEDSIDYAVMEGTDRGAVVPLRAAWSDLGSWAALLEGGDKDAAGNVLTGDVLVEGTKDCYLHSRDSLLTAVGISDLIVVVTSDAVLVAHKDKTQEVKTIVRRLRKAKRGEAVTHRKVYRPWGSYETTDCAARFQVKRITVKPGQVLSLQKHHHRAEHWVVVRGTAAIVNGDKEFLLTEDQSAYIPVGGVHRLGNPGNIPLEIIEVQTGSYLGEDDIVRIEDVYHRIKD